MAATRTLQGVELPTAGTWTIDPGHAEVGFIGRHFGLTKVRGRFVGVTGMVTVADAIEASGIVVDIEMDSVNSGDQSRDDHLRSPDFFDVEHHPTATFRSTGISSLGSKGTVSGELTIKGINRPVTLNVEYLGHATDPWGVSAPCSVLTPSSIARTGALRGTCF
jgi:polyisoprenoid-binding protein YceI